jgi:LysM repeat protein
MAHDEMGGPDALACPHLGLAADPRSHFTYPHPGHRCFVKDRAAVTDPGCQATHCLSGSYTGCDRYRVALASLPPKERPLPREERPLPRANVQESATIAFRVHVVRIGESLAGIAADHGVTADQIARANGLAVTNGIAAGARLVIPLVQASSSYGSDP